MRFKHALMIVLAVVALPGYSAVASLVGEQSKSTKAENVSGVEYASRFRHTHRHCHITITLGHVRKHCHTHRHNKIVHHGAVYH